MELWIRSQDKKVLRRVYSLGIYERNNKWHIAENLMMDFGVYKTEKRALEVLDEIQDFITLNEKINGDYKEKDLKIKSVFVANQLKIFQMPEE